MVMFFGRIENQKLFYHMLQSKEQGLVCVSFGRQLTC